MATLPATDPLRQLYRGRTDTHSGIGALLKDMVSQGRQVVREETLRWQENREMYRGNQWISVSAGERALRVLGSSPLAPNAGGSGQSTYNLLRKFTDSGVSLLTSERPPYEVSPEDRDANSIDAAKQAEKLISARWGQQGWDIKGKLSELAKNGRIDGIAWLFVGWDPDLGKTVGTPIAVRNDGTPVIDRAEYEALKAQDPEMQTWRMEPSRQPVGDVVWRVVLPGAMSVDPFAVAHSQDARWVCESAVRPREEVEEKLGMEFREAVRKSAGSSGMSDVQYEDLVVDDTSGRRTVSESEGVIVHHFYAKPQPNWPRGARIVFADRAPETPLDIGEWDDELPYQAYLPRPDSGHFLRSKGIVDDLKPIQRDFNATLRDVREWLRRTARTPVAIPFQSMMSEAFYNDDGYFEFRPGLGEPHYLQTPQEPSAILTNYLQWAISQMERVSGISAYSQGMLSPGGPQAAAGINMLMQQTEQDMSEEEHHLKESIEWGVGRTLELVRDNYVLPRAVIGVGVDDSEEFAAFQGAMLRGAHRFRITGPLMPKSKASRMQAIQQFAPILGEKIVPYIAQLIDADPTELQRDIEVDRQREKNDIRQLITLATDEKAFEVFKNFEEDKRKFSQVVNVAQEQGSQDPIGDARRMGIQPPVLTDALQTAGFDIPVVEDFLEHGLSLKALNDFRKSDAYRKLSPMGKQLLRERADRHTQLLGQQVAAMAQQMPPGQQGSEPAEKGDPSPPKQQPPPTPGGMG